jgi:protein TonB
MRKELHDYFATEIAVDMEEEKEKEEEPEPEVVEPETKEEIPVAQPEPDKEEDPYENDEPAPIPAEAPDTLTTDAVDMTGEGWDMVDKDGSKRTGGGFTSEKGTAKKPVRNKRARIDGEERGKGRGPARRKKANQTRAAMPEGSTEWNCPFPPQADLEQVDKAAVLISVTVASDGTPKSVNVISDPGYGFGQMAKRCALTRRYRPGLDAEGNAITASTPQLRVTFTR